MNQRETAAAMAFVTAAMAVVSVAAAPVTARANTSNLDYRKRVIGISGIMANTSTDMDRQVTRGEFAKMLVGASTYRDYLPSASQVSVYADVPAENENAASIRIAAEQKWMVGYLGGQFRPDQPVTLKEAVRGVLALLGYTDEDFTGDVSGARMSLFYSLDLNEDLDRQPAEVLTKTDCVNLFYNLLKTEMKSGGKVYATVLGCEVNSDGEINPIGLADSSLKGPKLIPKGHQLGNYIPFNVQEASIFIDGEASSYDSLKSVLSGSYVVIYYNQSAKTVWAYVADDDGDGVQNGRCAVRGEVTSIYYNSTDVMTPTSVYLDGDEDQEFKLGNSEMQFAFSVYGSLRVGDTVTLICEKTTNAEGDVTYTVIDYVED
ncbi:S-layer homology domain-containing protein [Clostridium sp. AN503]|uniref:S-layer homology domain-containing protein n=1 Tax=Clostridium sp. AN503 TaxID=3160598 RepID=UPI00345921EE